MAQNKVKNLLEDIPEKQLEKAQEKLNQWCDSFGMDRITLSHEKARWRELCFHMLGLPYPESKATGRRNRFCDDEVIDIIQHIYVETGFAKMNGEKKTIYDAAKELTDRYDLKSGNYRKSNNTSIKNTVKNLMRVRYKEILKKQGKEDYEIDTPYEEVFTSNNKNKKN